MHLNANKVPKTTILVNPIIWSNLKVVTIPTQVRIRGRRTLPYLTNTTYFIEQGPLSQLKIAIHFYNHYLTLFFL